METRRTNLSTDVCTDKPAQGKQAPTARWAFELNGEFEQREFVPPQQSNIEEALQTLEELLERLTDFKLAKRAPKPLKLLFAQQNQDPYKQNLDRKRKKIEGMFMAQDKPKLSAIAKACSADFNTVKRLYRQFLTTGSVEQFQYCNKHLQEDEERLQQSIDNIHTTFKSVSDLKRQHRNFSKKFIRKRLRTQDLRWKRVPKILRPKKSRRRQPDSERIRFIITALAKALTDDCTEVFYADEMKLPLHQTSEFHWTKDKQPDSRTYGMRNSRDLLTAIALCSTRRFEAVKIVEGEVNSIDVVHFIERFIESLPKTKRYIILVDNAPWHKSNIIQSSDVKRFLLFNEPYQFRLNMIENAFSYVRQAFRKRQDEADKHIEMDTALKIFFEEFQQVKFEGYFRNHIRNLIDVGNQHRFTAAMVPQNPPGRV